MRWATWGLVPAFLLLVAVGPAHAQEAPPADTPSADAPAAEAAPAGDVPAPDAAPPDSDSAEAAAEAAAAAAAAGGDPEAEEDPGAGIPSEVEVREARMAEAQAREAAWYMGIELAEEADDVMVELLTATEYMVAGLDGISDLAQLADSQISLLAELMGNHTTNGDRLRRLSLLARTLDDRVRWVVAHLPEKVEPAIRDELAEVGARSHELNVATYFDAENVGAGILRFLGMEAAREYRTDPVEHEQRFPEADLYYTKSLGLSIPTHHAQRSVRALLYLERGMLRAEYQGESPELATWLDKSIDDVRTAIDIGLPNAAALEHARVTYGETVGRLFDELEKTEQWAALVARAAILDVTEFDWNGKAKSYIQAADAARRIESERAEALFERAVSVIANRTGLRYGELLETIAERIAVSDVGLVNPRIVLEVQERKRSRNIWSVELYGVRYVRNDAQCALLDKAVSSLRDLGRSVTAGSLERRVVKVLCRAPPPPPKKKKKKRRRRRRKRR